MNFIEKNLHDVREQIAQVCERIGRDPNEIELVAVSKKKPYSVVESAYSAGQRIFGENIAQEIRDKAGHSDLQNIRWHFIGHLQTNKIKFVIPFASLIHSIDSFKLANAIDGWIEKHKQFYPVEGLIQIRTAREETKYGIDPDTFFEELDQWKKISNIRFRGVMTMATNTEDVDEIRRCFKEAKAFFIKLNEMNIQNMDMKWLSMGMTGDYAIAIEEGANMLRIGSAIFGARQY